jgi:type II secretory pathway pseudopilin PulG
MQIRTTQNKNGFSMIELIIAMAVTMTIMALASTLLASSFNARSREDRKSDAIADVQRALNINGIVAGDSNAESLRVVSNLNGMPDPLNGYFEDSDVTDTDEDVKFLMYVDNTIGQRYIVRYEKNGTNQTTVLANRIDSLVFRYYDEKVTYQTTVNSDGEADITSVVNAAGTTENEVSSGSAKFVVIAVGVTLPAVGASGTNGYQPETQITLTSDVVLRNSIVY